MTTKAFSRFVYDVIVSTVIKAHQRFCLHYHHVEVVFTFWPLKLHHRQHIFFCKKKCNIDKLFNFTHHGLLTLSAIFARLYHKLVPVLLRSP